MKRLKVNLFVGVVGAVLLALLLAPAVAQAAAWSVVQSPNATAGNNELHAVTSISANDVWAVGTSENNLGNSQTLILHWDGTAWSIVPSPTTGIVEGNLLGVAAVSATDVWAVGNFLPTKGSGQGLIEHWNGHKWSVVKSPITGASTGLQAVAAVSTNDVWAVGTSFNASGVEQTFIEHWNGKQWSIVASPSPSTQTNFLLGVTAVSTNDVWAVGSFQNASGAFQTLTLHWDGTAWSIVASPSGAGSADLFGVAAVSTSDVWAVGDSGSGTLIEQWNGSSWSVVSSPSPSTLANLFFAVAIVSANDIWAVGESQNATSGISQTLIEQWNGSSWSVVSSPNPGSGSSPGDSLRGAAADPSSGQAWAVGQFTAASGATQTLTEFNP
ncbi:MAG: hypothetical protein ACJ8CB_08780 [Ktedonobacteraceae bacterium]